MIRRRPLLLALAASAAGCSVLPERPYQERRLWPLTASRPGSPVARTGTRVLLVRDITAGPGLETRALQRVDARGVLHLAYWDEWSAPPADAVEASLRAWLAASGRFRAVVGPGSRAVADWVLEGELDQLAATSGEMRTSLGITVLYGNKPILQRRLDVAVPLASDRPADIAAGGCAALGRLCAAVEQALAEQTTPSEAASGHA